MDKVDLARWIKLIGEMDKTELEHFENFTLSLSHVDNRDKGNLTAAVVNRKKIVSTSTALIDLPDLRHGEL